MRGTADQTIEPVWQRFSPMKVTMGMPFKIAESVHNALLHGGILGGHVHDNANPTKQLVIIVAVGGAHVGPAPGRPPLLNQGYGHLLPLD
jgi:hypothetical protein